MTLTEINEKLVQAYIVDTINARENKESHYAEDILNALGTLYVTGLFKRERLDKVVDFYYHEMEEEAAKKRPDLFTKLYAKGEIRK